CSERKCCSKKIPNSSLDGNTTMFGIILKTLKNFKMELRGARKNNPTSLVP
ncbi:Unknown protein, partial [Striga hermonthica]